MAAKKPDGWGVKPYADFPLTPHASGYWAKKIAGKRHYFGPRWGDAKDALKEYHAVSADLQAGRTPIRGELSVEDAFNLFLGRCDKLREVNKMSDSTFAKYRRTAARVADCLGRKRTATSLRPDDFSTLATEYIYGFDSPATQASEVVRTKAMFHWLHANEHIPNAVNFGTDFAQPSLRERRLARQRAPKREFTAAEVRALLEGAGDKLKAMILLGVNCGFGNDDIARLASHHLDDGWAELPRHKTGVPRRCPLWVETITALDRVIETQPKARTAAARPLVFRSKRGGPYETTKNSNISQEFRKLLNEAPGPS